MPPFLSTVKIPDPILHLHGQLAARDVTSIAELKSQWRNPNDILSLLLLLGPDVIQRALAQLVGRRMTPVAFSFGWAAYSIGALFSTFGGKLNVLDNAVLMM